MLGGTVYDEFRGQGIGTLLYVAAAQWLAERFGLPLRSSTLQTAQAEAAWKRMASNPDLPIRKGRAWGKPVYAVEHPSNAHLAALGVRFGE